MGEISRCRFVGVRVVAADVGVGHIVHTTRHDVPTAASVVVSQLQVGQHCVLAGHHGVVHAQAGLTLANNDIQGDCSNEGDGRDGREREEGLVDTTDRNPSRITPVRFRACRQDRLRHAPAQNSQRREP